MKKIKNKKSNKKVSKTNKIISLILLITSLIFAIIVTYINIVSLKDLWIVYFVISFIDIDGITDIFIEPAINREQKVYLDTECGIAYIDIECDNDIFNHLIAFKETHLFDTK